MAFRQKTLLPLDDVLGCLRDTIPNLSRSALHRCLQRHGISKAAEGRGQRQAQPVQELPDWSLDIDSCELRHTDGKLVMFLAIDRVSENPPTSSSTTAPERRRAQLFWGMSWPPSPTKSTPC